MSHIGLFDTCYTIVAEHSEVRVMIWLVFTGRTRHILLRDGFGSHPQTIKPQTRKGWIACST